jgi:outer membrane protein assembly factor BamA
LTIILSIFLVADPILKSVEIVGSSKLSKKYIDPIIKTYIGTEVTRENLQSLINDILKHYEDNGLPLAKVLPKSLVTVNDSVTLTIQIEDGPFVVVEEIQFKGLKRTKKKILTPFFPIKGKLFRASIVKRGIRELNSWGLVKIDSFGFRKIESNYLLVMYVSDEAKNTLKGFVSVRSGSNPVGELNIFAKNLLGTGRSLFLSWKRIALGEQRLKGTYREPFLFGTKNFGELGLEYEFRENLLLKREGMLMLGRRSVDWSISLGIKRKENLDYVIDKEEKLNYLLLNVGIHRKAGRDLYESQIEGEVGRKKRFSLGFLYRHRFPKFDISIYLKGCEVIGANIMRFDLFYYGGKGDLRGFGEEQFLVKSGRFGRLELSNLLGTGLFTFLEGALLWTLSERITPFDFGLGVTGRSPMGKIRVYLAFPWGQPLGNGIISLDLQGVF